MHVVIHLDADGVAAAAAQLVGDALRAAPDLAIALPTGRTAIPFYRALVRRHQMGRADFRRATTFNLDEFAGVGAGDAGSYAEFMRAHLFDHVNLQPSRRHLFDGRARQPGHELMRIETEIARAGGLDLAVLGIGGNGHIAFNEPGRALVARSHVARLDASSRRANAHLFGRRLARVPKRALTMGVATILSARRVVLMATGAGKARVVRRALTGPVTTGLPASLLQAHPDVVILLDRAAANGLPGASGPGLTISRRE